VRPAFFDCGRIVVVPEVRHSLTGEAAGDASPSRPAVEISVGLGCTHTIDRFRGGRASLFLARARVLLFHVFRPRDRDGRGRANVQDDTEIGWGQGKRQRVEEEETCGSWIH